MTRVLTVELMAQAMGCPVARAAECFDTMVAAMRRFAITTPRRIALFLGQAGHESAGLVYFGEIAPAGVDARAYFNGKYSGRADLGNRGGDDGYNYRGSGPIQVTGRSNFLAAQAAIGRLLGIDIVATPELVRTPRYGPIISAWWWEAHGGNTVAEREPVAVAIKACGLMIYRGNPNSAGALSGELDRATRTARILALGDLALPAEIGGEVLPADVTPAPAGDWLDTCTLPELQAAVVEVMH